MVLPNVQECDASGDAICAIAGLQKWIINWLYAIVGLVPSLEAQAWGRLITNAGNSIWF